MTAQLAASQSEVRVSLATDPVRWDAYVDSRADATAYHRWAWGDVISQAFGHETRYLVAEADGSIAGVLPLVRFNSRIFGRSLVSMPFLNYGGILASSRAAEDALLAAAIEQAAACGAHHVELRHSSQKFAALPCKRHKVAMVRHVEADEETLFAALDRKLRNQIRKGQKSGFRAEIGGRELLPAFYDVFVENMRDLGTPVYSVRFFEQVLRAFPNDSRVFAVFAGERPVAGAIVCSFRDTLEAPWASSLRAFNSQCANVLLYWEMLRYASGRFQWFDFGRSTPGEGTFHFKRQWGAQPRELVWEYWLANGAALPNLSPANPRFQRAIAVWRRLPLSATRTIGPWIVRNTP